MLIKTLHGFLFSLVFLAASCLVTDFAHADSPPAPVAEASAETADDPFDDPFADDDTELQVADPLEPVNRAFFWFNDKLYFYLLKPVARVYRVIPEPARVSVGNLFSNLAAPIRFVNSLLQFKVNGAGAELARFGVNSTIGILGLFDPAKSWLNLNKSDEDFGQTLGFYGAGNGFYLVLPVLGPSNLRDTIGRAGDYFVDPISSPHYFILNDWEEYALKGLNTVNSLSLDKDTYEGIKRDALDPYLFLRNSYTQYRQAKIKK